MVWHGDFAIDSPLLVKGSFRTRYIQKYHDDVYIYQDLLKSGYLSPQGFLSPLSNKEDPIPNYSPLLLQRN